MDLTVKAEGERENLCSLEVTGTGDYFCLKKYYLDRNKSLYFSVD